MIEYGSGTMVLLPFFIPKDFLVSPSTPVTER